MGGAVEFLSNSSDRSSVSSFSLHRQALILLAFGWVGCSFLCEYDGDVQYQRQRSNVVVEGFSVVVRNRYKSIPSLGISTNGNHQTYPARTQTTTTTTDLDDESFATNNDKINDLDWNYTKSHSLTVCIVPPPPPPPPPPSFNKSGTNELETTNHLYKEAITPNTTSLAWDVLTKLRVELRDPGLYRWPPHINLLYPFVRDDTNASLTKLSKAARNVEPFWVLLDLSRDSSSSSSSSSETNFMSKGFGTFGSSTRGVLWVYPESFRSRSDKESSTIEPILELQSLLEKEFPMCSESLKRRNFLPHLTLSSKFDSLQDARAAESGLIQPTKLWFWCQEFYLLERDGEHGQFRKRATIPLGTTTTTNCTSSSTSQQQQQQQQPAISCVVHDPPLGFQGMPESEEDWVAVELQALKDRRKANRINNRPRGRTRKSYRARRREKKKQAAEEEQEQEQEIDNNKLNCKNATRPR